ncbi:MAG: hypothetical protein ABFC57_17400 [Veillonellales bacterium]
MADIVFPDIGHPLYSGSTDFSEDFQHNTISSKMDGGYTVTRPGQSRSPGIWVVPYKLSNANYQILMNFYRNTISCGAVEFTWTHPIFGTTHVVRMTDKAVFIPVEGGFWKGSFTLEEV